MTFDSLQNVIEFQGEDYTRCYVPEAEVSLEVLNVSYEGKQSFGN